MEEVTKLIEAASKLLWPILSFAALLIFRPQLVQLITRLRKGKLFGQEIELDKSLDKLDASTREIEATVQSEPAVTHQDRSVTEAEDAVVLRILNEASRSPEAALLLLSAQIEREIRQLLASLGILGDRRNVSLSQALNELNARYGGLPGFVPAAYRNFTEARNLIVHGGSAETKDVLRAIDSGLTILKGIRALPHEKYVVYQPNIPLYSDSLCQNLRAGVTGIMLEAEAPGSRDRVRRIYPTTRDYYEKGQAVAWEWNGTQKWGETWYCDPDTQEAKQAWGESAEFVGRPLERI